MVPSADQREGGLGAVKRWLVYDGEWVKTTGMSERFSVALQPCEFCRRMSMGPLWYSIRRKKVRCLKCFTPREYSGTWRPKNED